jgi:hypothetical protein
MHRSCLTAADNELAATDTYIFILCHLSLQIDQRWSHFIHKICPLEQQSSYAILSWNVSSQNTHVPVTSPLAVPAVAVHDLKVQPLHVESWCPCFL